MVFKAFLIGYDTFDLNYCKNDLKFMRNGLLAHGFSIIIAEKKNPPKILKSDLITQLDAFLDSCNSTDTIIIYFTGHAYAPKGELLLLLSDEINKINSSSIKLSYLTGAIESCNAKNKLLILDCCHALSEIADWRPPQSEVYRILAASGRLEKAKEIEKFQSSFLTYQIFRGLTENYYDIVKGDSELTVNELYNWILDESKKYNRTHDDIVPLPKLLGNQGNDFPISESKVDSLPIQFRIYLSQLYNCFSDCNRACFGRYPWCRMTLESNQVNTNYVIPRIKYSEGGFIFEDRLDIFFDHWLHRTENHLAILGDSGMGKSSACIFLASHLAYQFLQRDYSVQKIPILLSLESLVSHNLLGKDIKTIMSLLLFINVDSSLIDRFVNEGRFVFILDGFDEIADKADHSRIVKNLNNLDPILFSKCKTVLTCRTHFFVNQEQIEQVLIGGSNAGTELYALFKERTTAFNIVELQDFSVDEIKRLITNISNEQPDEIWSTICGLYNLEDLSKRPILLILILKTLPNLKISNSPINRAEIYRTYVEFWLTREAGRIETDIDITRKEKFIESIAIELWKRSLVSMSYVELQTNIRNEYSDEIFSNIDFLMRDYDTRNASFLNRDDDGYYKFMHKSFMEYFTASYLVRSINSNKEGMESWNIKWFDKEVASFISELLQQKRFNNKINIIIAFSLGELQKTFQWNILHTLSLLKKDIFNQHGGSDNIENIIMRSERENNAVILRQYCRIISRFGDEQKARLLIRKIIEIVRENEGQNIDNNNTYINYYYGRTSACEALINHLSVPYAKYDRELHVYVLGEIGEKRHILKLETIIQGWDDPQEINLAKEAINKIKRRETSE